MTGISFATATDSLVLLWLSLLSAVVVAYSANTSARLVPPLLSWLPGALCLAPDASIVVEIHRSKLRWIGRGPSADFSSHQRRHVNLEDLHLMMPGLQSEVHESHRQPLIVSHVGLQTILASGGHS